jgi:hypothetical protein
MGMETGIIAWRTSTRAGLAYGNPRHLFDGNEASVRQVHFDACENWLIGAVDEQLGQRVSGLIRWIGIDFGRGGE